MKYKLNYNNLKKILIVAGLGLAYYIWLRLTGLALKCPMYAISRHHIKCPGCGISRACISEMHLDFAAAAHYNIVFFVFQPVWAVCIVMWLFDCGERFRRVVSIISLAALIAFFVLRNLPFVPVY